MRLYGAVFEYYQTPMNWKKQIISSLHERDLAQKIPFENIVKDYAKLYRSVALLYRENQGLHNDLKCCRQENTDMSMKLEKINLSKSYDYEQKVFRLQEEVTDLHRQKGSLAADVIDLNKQVQERDKLAHQMNAKLSDLETNQKIMQCANSSLTDQINSLEQTNKVSYFLRITVLFQLLEEEKMSVENVNRTLEAKIKQIEDDRLQLIQKLTELQATVEKLKNIEYDLNYRKTRETIRRNLQEAVNEPSSMISAPLFSVIPQNVLAKLDTNSGEINCVRFTPSGKRFGSAGFDRKLRIWSCTTGKCDLLFTLSGCSAPIASIDFDPEESLALAASSDFSCRLWTLNDYRSRSSLTGHFDKVVAAKFMGTRHHVVTASSDRTIKVWNVDSCQCKWTAITPSTAQDVVASSRLKAVVTGHFDNNIRVWDERNGSNITTVNLSGRITGLDIASDLSTVVACTRNNTVELVDLLQNKVVHRMTAEGFRVGVHIVRPCFSPDAKYVAVGGHDGGVYIWNVNNGGLETVLREHTATVVCCHWNPDGYSLVSCERLSKIVLWGRL